MKQAGGMEDIITLPCCCCHVLNKDRQFGSVVTMLCTTVMLLYIESSLYRDR